MRVTTTATFPIFRPCQQSLTRLDLLAAMSNVLTIIHGQQGGASSSVRPTFPIWGGGDGSISIGQWPLRLSPVGDRDDVDMQAVRV